MRAVVLATSILGLTLVVYFYQSSSEESEIYPLSVIITNEPQEKKYPDKSKPEILSDIKIQFSIDNYRSQLEEHEQQLHTKYKHADLVERIVLERELTIQINKIDNYRQLYSKKVNLLAETYQSLKNIKDAFQIQDYNSAQVALIKGDTSYAYELFSQVEFKLRNARDRKEINRAADAAYHRGKIAEDQIDYRKAYRHYRRAVMFSPENIQYLLEAGKIAISIALYSNAINYYEAALHIQKSENSKSSQDFRQIWINLGTAWNSKGNPNKAIEYFRLVLARDLKAFGPNHLYIAVDKNNLGWAWETKGKLNKAINYYKQALRLNETKLGIMHPTTLLVKENLEAATRLSTNDPTRRKRIRH